MGYNQGMENRYVLFIDFLGASHAARTWTEERLQDFIDLLYLIKAAEVEESVSGEAMPDGGYMITVSPKVTAFSDCMVVSYGDRENEMPPGFWTDLVCQDCVRILRQVAERAMKFGILIRGGLAYGRCHHANGVLFGEAMADAYHLESGKNEAVNPRVLVSQSVIDRLRIDRPENVRALLQDTDERWHLNYFIDLVRESVPEGEDMLQRTADWVARCRGIIEENITALEGHDRAQEKWKWFADRFAHSTSKLGY
jgi:class 3 adenylate cyclase